MSYNTAKHLKFGQQQWYLSSVMKPNTVNLKLLLSKTNDFDLLIQISITRFFMLVYTWVCDISVLPKEFYSISTGNSLIASRSICKMIKCYNVTLIQNWFHLQFKCFFKYVDSFKTAMNLRLICWKDRNRQN